MLALPWFSNWIITVHLPTLAETLFVPLWWAWVLADMLVDPVILICGTCTRRFGVDLKSPPMKVDIAAERQGIFAFLVFGDCFLALLHSHGHDGWQLVQRSTIFLSLVLILLFLIAIFYELLVSDKIGTEGNGFITWLHQLLHLPFLMSVMLAGLAGEQAIMHLSFSDVNRQLFCACVAVALLTITSLQLCQRGPTRRGRDRGHCLRLCLKAAVAMLVYLLTYVPSTWLPAHALLLIVAFLVGTVLLAETNCSEKNTVTVQGVTTD